MKNSVIVPVGAKGGFICKQLPSGDRDAVMEEVVACYRIFIGALLDVTDNLVSNDAVPARDVVSHDDIDTYLVVAADKGTATFSDIANEIAESRRYWLGDAFASGGSAGYDHKALAITARGAWVSVQRHFAQLGTDVAKEPFTAVGIGDMSGDVFGNGMLRSQSTLLVAAFDHRDIFIDPTPNATSSYAERQRLFDLPRSSWADYDQSLISVGGGVFSRSAKSVTLNDHIREALGLDGVESLRPNDLIRAILKAPVDLLWNGGIGTYVKASTESTTDVGDRGNDAVRVDASELRCLVVGEGGNLGITQLGRVEFARAGGAVNTDAIDNSGGVDCSDREVNLKVLMAQAIDAGDLTRKQRDQLLESIADDVCDLVLANNEAQNDALTAAMAESVGMIEVHQRLMSWLEAGAGLDRSLEALPSNVDLLARRQSSEGLWRPELAVLMAYTKNHLTEELITSDLADDPDFNAQLLSYFPSALHERFGELVADHQLRRELLCTLVSNNLVNHGGVSMVHRLIEETSATVADIARAHKAAWMMFDLGHLLRAVTTLEHGILPTTRTSLHLEIMRLGERATRWLLRNEAQPLDISGSLSTYEQPIRELFEMMASADANAERHIGHALDVPVLIAAGVPEDLAHRVAALDTAFGFLDLVAVSSRTDSDLKVVAAIYSTLDGELDLSWLRQRIVELPRADHWQTLARSALRDEYYREHAQLTAAVIADALDDAANRDDAPADAVSATAAWRSRNSVAVDRCLQTFSDIRSVTEHDLARVSVAVRALSQLSRAH